MNNKVKVVANFVASVIQVFWKLIPNNLRIKIFTGFFYLESRGRDATFGLRQLFGLKDSIDWLINERAMAYGAGQHPKHRLTKYHDFFSSNIENGDRVLDLGCGYGAVALSIAAARPDCKIIGVDNDPISIALARERNDQSNVKFVLGNILDIHVGGEWDVVVLSNVLEHITDRTFFLRKVLRDTQAKSILIRVPLFERDWQMALRRELGVDFRSDDDHKIEHTFDEFREEIKASGLNLRKVILLWGEIWAQCVPGDEHE